VNEPESKSPLIDWEKLMAEVERPELYYRRPGRFRRWEIGAVVDRGGDFRIMEDGLTADNTRLYAVYRRDPGQHAELQAALDLVGLSSKVTVGLAPAERAPPPAASRVPTPGPLAASSTAVRGAADDLEARARAFSGAPLEGAPQQTLMLQDPLADRRLVRMPGLFVRWELEQLLEPGADYHIEPSGTLMDGSDLFAVFRRGPAIGPSDG
jgi:hypothetical protein